MKVCEQSRAYSSVNLLTFQAVRIHHPSGLGVCTVRCGPKREVSSTFSRYAVSCHTLLSATVTASLTMVYVHLLSAPLVQVRRLALHQGSLAEQGKMSIVPDWYTGERLLGSSTLCKVSDAAV